MTKRNYDYVRLQTLADEMGQKLWPVAQSVRRMGIRIFKVSVEGMPRNAISEVDAVRWKASRNTPNVR
jgi:hypothetical protein